MEEDARVDENFKLCLELEEFNLVLQDCYRNNDGSGRVAAFAQPTMPMSSEEKEERLADIEEFLMEEGFPEEEESTVALCNSTFESPLPPPSGGSSFSLGGGKNAVGGMNSLSEEFECFVMSPRSQTFLETFNARTYGEFTVEDETEMFSQSGNIDQAVSEAVRGSPPPLPSPEDQVEVVSSSPEKAPEVRVPEKELDAASSSNAERPSSPYTIRKWWAEREEQRRRDKNKKRSKKRKGKKSQKKRKTVQASSIGPQEHFFGRNQRNVPVVEQKKKKRKLGDPTPRLPSVPEVESTSGDGILTRLARQNRQRLIDNILRGRYNCYIPLIKLTSAQLPQKLKRGRGRPRKYKRLPAPSH